MFINPPKLPLIKAEWLARRDLWIATDPDEKILAIASDVDVLAATIADSFPDFDGFDLITLSPVIEF